VTGVTIQTATLLGFLMALARTASWLTIAPVFAGTSVPVMIRAMISMALAIPITPVFAAHAPSADTGSLITALAGQIMAGLALGFLTRLLFSAVEAAGQFIDLFGGFTLAAAYDPLSQNQSGPMGRAFQFIATTLLFVTNGYLLLIHGLMSTDQALPLTGTGQNMLGYTLTESVGRFFLGALEIAAPLLAVLILADIAMALLSKAAPALNVFQLSFPVKILVTLLMIGLALPILPDYIQNVVVSALHAGQHNGLVGP
jgi:flagellar biosynthetic protein FliR